MRRWLWLLLLAGPAFAGNGISDITVVKGRNLTSVAIEGIVSGDDDSSAVLRIFQRLRGSGNSFDTGMVMIRRPGFTIHEGRILRMSPGVVVDFFIQAVDAGGGFSTPVDTVSCRIVTPIVATGPVFYVAKSGADVNPGTLASPKLTIGAALTALSGSTNSGRNGGVIVAPGEYHERLDLNFGGDGFPRFLMGDGTNRDSTIICGANEMVEAGKYGTGAGTALSWNLRPCTTRAASADSTYATPFPSVPGPTGTTPGDSTMLVVIGWGEMLHRKTSLAALGNDSTYIGSGTTSTNSGEVSGWFWTAESLFVKRRTGASPAGITLHTGYRDNLILVTKPDWHISNLTLRFGGGLNSAARITPPTSGQIAGGWTTWSSPGMLGYGVVLGATGVGGASRYTIDSLRCYGLNAVAIHSPLFAAGQRSDTGTVTNCFLDGLTVGTMTYGAGKSRAEEVANESELQCSAYNLDFNTMTGSFNGPQTGLGNADSTSGRFSEVVGNYISHCPDDGIEMDSMGGPNCLVMGNTMFDTGSGISFAPDYYGPIFMFYNTVAEFKQKGLKLGGGNTAVIKVYQNTFASNQVSQYMGVPGTNEAVSSIGIGVTDNMEFVNNIFVSKGAAGVMNVDNQFSTTTNTFNYDLWDSISTTRLAKIDATSYSLPTLQTSLGWEMNGARGAVSFADSAGGRWQLNKDRSKAIGIGKRLSGINTDLNGRLIGNGRLVQVGSHGCFGGYCPDWTP